MNILITGAAGYVGSMVAEETIKAGHNVIALDNLSVGHKEAVSREAVFVPADFGDPNALDAVFRNHKIDAVMHIGALALVGQSNADPGMYFQNNVVGSLNLLNTMLKHHVNNLVFSSSCAVYGYPEHVPINEKTPKNPINAYGETKLAFERILFWYASAYQLNSVSLRYFNAAGASDRFGEDHAPETHLIPNIIRVALGRDEYVSVFGRDYPTDDGSCVRDYVHVADIGSAHLLALQYITNRPGCHAFNLGNEKGYSVLEIINAVEKASGVDLRVVFKERRSGDPPVLVADSNLAKSELGWKPCYTDINKIIESAYKWMKQHPDGYSTIS